MKKFESLDNRDVNLVEKSIREKFLKDNILDKCISNRDGCENFVFYDGPATANGMPGVHHILAKLLKDTFCKYKKVHKHKDEITRGTTLIYEL